MSTRKRLIKGSALNLVAMVFNQGSTFIANIIVARILLKHGFGEYAMVQNTLLTMATLSQVSTGYTAAKYIAEYRVIEPLRAGRIMGMCAVISAMTAGLGTGLLMIMAPWLAMTMLKAPFLTQALWWGSGYLFFSAINGYQLGVLSGLEAYGSLAKTGVISGIVAVAAVAIGAYYGGLNGAFMGLSISALFRCLIHNRWLRLECRVHGIQPHYQDALTLEKKIIFKFALPAAIAGWYMTPMIWLANSFLVCQPGGYGEMALYSAANNLRILVLFLPNVINVVGLSVLNNEKSKGDGIQYDKVFRSNMWYIFLVSVGGAVVLGVLGKWLLGLFGKDFSGGQFLLWILLVSTIFEALNLGLYQYLQSQSKMWHIFLCVILPQYMFFIVMAYFFVPLYGGMGLAAAYLGSCVLGLMCNFAIVTVLYRKGT